MSYRLIYAKSVAKDLADIPGENRRRVWERINMLAENPLPPGVESLSGDLAGVKRVRVGNYRIGYVISGDVVEALLIDDRSTFYQRLRRKR